MIQQILTASIEIVVLSAVVGFPLLMLNDLVLGFRKYRAEKAAEIVADPNQYTKPAGPTEPHHYEPAGPQTLEAALAGEKMTSKQLKNTAKKLKIRGYSKMKKAELQPAIVKHLERELFERAGNIILMYPEKQSA